MVISAGKIDGHQPEMLLSTSVLPLCILTMAIWCVYKIKHDSTNQVCLDVSLASCQNMHWSISVLHHGLLSAIQDSREALLLYLTDLAMDQFIGYLQEIKSEDIPPLMVSFMSLFLT